MVRKMWFPPPSPNTKNHKFANLRFAQLRSAAFSVQPANEMHEKGDRGGGMEALLFYLGVWGSDCGLDAESGLSGGGSMVQPAISAEQGFALRPRADGKAGGE